VCPHQHRARFLQQNPPGFGRADAARMAIHWAHAELCFQTAEEAREPWLVHAEAFGRSRHMPLFGESNEGRKTA
jgi:hypothetical protein